MHHYTYLITYSDGKKYMSVRSCKCLPEEDSNYLGSSKHTPSKDMVISKEILALHSSRKEAVAAEVAYHAQHQVATNDLYYNKANQKTTGFDTSGTNLVFTSEHKLKIAAALKGKKRPPEVTAKIRATKLKQKRTFKHTQKFKDMVSRVHKGKTVPQESIAKMVSTRKANNSYKQTEETKAKIAQSLIENPPYASPVQFTQNGISTVYKSIAECSRSVGISAATMKGRLNRKRNGCINGWAIEYIN